MTSTAQKSRLKSKVDSILASEIVDAENLQTVADLIQAGMQDVANGGISEDRLNAQYKTKKLELISKIAGWVICAALIGIFVVAKCGYEVKEDKRGRTIRIDKWTGDISILDGNTLVRPETEEEQKARQEEIGQKEREELGALSKEHKWPVQGVPKKPDVKVHLSTMWRDGQLWYKLDLEPVSPKFLQLRDMYGAGDNLTLKYLDRQGFTVLSADTIFTGRLTPEVDDKGKTNTLSYEGSVACSKAAYLNIASWSFTYSLHDYSSLDVVPPPPPLVPEQSY